MKKRKVKITTSRMEQDPWYRPRGYVHFDYKISKNKAKNHIENTGSIEKHSFWPFIKKSQSTQRYKSAQNKTVDKERPIMYASHIDSCIYSWYSQKLSSLYEEKIQGSNIDASVLAYRNLGKSNIDFAKEVFDAIESQENCTVLTLDISKFFDNIDHQILKESWGQLLDNDNSILPKDHYKIYRSITKYSYINLSDICKELKVTQKELHKQSRICSASDFRNNLEQNIETNQNNYGIPQGSPISALLSNIFMWEFDIEMVKYVQELGGIYRRYCDDILFVLPLDCHSIAIEKVIQELGKLGLEINKEKTELFSFKKTDVRLECIYHSLKFDNDNNHSIEPQTTKSRALQYLGFVFDGKTRSIRSQTISRYYRRMKRGIFFTRKAARKSSEGRIIYRKGLYERFTHLGKRNFIKYAYRASTIMNSPEIKRQTRRHWKKLHDEIQ